MYKTIDLELHGLLLYIKEQNNTALADAFEQSAPTILKKVLGRSIRFKNVFNEVLIEFAILDRLGEGLKK